MKITREKAFHFSFSFFPLFNFMSRTDKKCILGYFKKKFKKIFFLFLTSFSLLLFVYKHVFFSALSPLLFLFLSWHLCCKKRKKRNVVICMPTFTPCMFFLQPLQRRKDIMARAASETKKSMAAVSSYALDSNYITPSPLPP